MSNNMGHDKSILQKIADAVKDIATVATNAANDALKAEAPAPKAREAVVTDVPLAGMGLVSDPMMVPPIALVPARKKRRVAAKPAAKAARKNAKKAAKKFVGLAKKSAAGKSRKAAKKTTKNTAEKAVEKAARKTKKSVAKKTAKKARKSARR
jgi:hypothetical protein